jgi:hypothetical protein
MAKYKALAATRNVDSQGQRFSDEALSQLALTCRGKLVTLEFNQVLPPLGQILDAEVTERGLEVEVDLPGLPEDFNASVSYIVPGFFTTGTKEESRGVEVFDNVRANDFGLTASPADTSLEPIKPIKE